MKAKKILPGTKTLSRLLDISPEAKRRLKWFDWYQSHGRKVLNDIQVSPEEFLGFK